MLTRALLVVAALGGIAHADAAKAAKLLRDGRALEAKDPKAAQAKLQLALAESPEDATIMAELGYAALLAKDYATAEAMTKKAIARATDTKVKAAATWNLGDILAAKGDKKGADAAHAEAKKLREAAKVEAAHGSFGTLETSFTVKPLEGPFKSIDAFCAKWEKHEDEAREQFAKDDEVQAGCTALEDVKGTLLGHQVRIVDSGWETREKIHETWHHVAIQMPDGWYVGEIDAILSAGGTGEGNMKLTPGKLDVVDLGGGAQALAIHDGMWVQDVDDPSYEVETKHDDLALCGIGKSGKPSCIRAFQIGGFHEITDRGKPTKTEAWAVVPSFPKNGTIVFAADKTKKQAPPDDKLVGAHAIAFP